MTFAFSRHLLHNYHDVQDSISPGYFVWKFHSDSPTPKLLEDIYFGTCCSIHYYLPNKLLKENKYICQFSVVFKRKTTSLTYCQLSFALNPFSKGTYTKLIIMIIINDFIYKQFHSYLQTNLPCIKRIKFFPYR